MNSLYLEDCLCRKKINIGKAFLQAQAELDVIDATATNAHFKNKYALLKDWYNGSKKSLRNHGIFIKHGAKFHPVTHQQVTCTYLWHAESGEIFEDERYLIPEKPGAQGHGISDTYMKRYALRSLLGCDVGEDDDDGEAEREYIAKTQSLILLIDNIPGDSQEIYNALLKEFKIKNVSEIGDHNLFYALMFVWKFVVNRSRAIKQM